MASSSLSHQRSQGSNGFSGIESGGKRRMVSESSRLYDVFINHRGPDVKQTLALQLYNSLEELGMRTFLDSEEKELGESFPSTIETAITSASVHIAIFSKRYAESAWCLTELVLMLQSQAKIIPVFYQVQPWELRFIEKGEYARAFTKYVNEKRYLVKLPEWKEALQSLSFVAGEEFNGDWNKIIAAVQKEVQRKLRLHVAAYPVGLDNLVEDFQRRCLNEYIRNFENRCGVEQGKQQVKVVGIFGMGGCGKTTLAKELFNRKSSNYCRASFLFDVREASVTGQLSALQGKLLKDLFLDHNLNLTSAEEGISYIKYYLQRNPNLSFLIVVDDIDHVDQLYALMIMDILNKFGNILIVITTRDVGVLVRAGVTDAYHLRGMDRNNGRELFCWYAFGQSHPFTGYEVLVDAFVDVCGGLPLSLQVLGRHVHGKPACFWRSALIKVSKTLPRDVKQRLRISFDALDDEEKQVYMDIACFFVGRSKSIAERVWEGSGWNAQYALEMLKDKCLVEETTEILSLNAHEGLVLKMHDHLRDLGREMALELRPPDRLWCPKDLKYLESMGFQRILTKTHVRCFHSIFDESMSSQVTFFLGQSYICGETSASLLWVELQGNSTEQLCIPSWISLQYVQCLKIKHGQLKTLWENHIQAPSQLKELHISETIFGKVSRFLRDIRQFSKGFLRCPRMANSRSSTLRGEQASTKIEDRTTCESLVILNFKFSGEVSWDNGEKSSRVKAPIGSLEKLEISGEESVSKILISGIHYPSLKSIKLHCMKNLKEVYLTWIKKLICLDIKNCKHLKSLLGISKLSKLAVLNISECPELEELSLGHPSCLESITIVDCKKLKSVSGSPDLRILKSNAELVTTEYFSVSGVLYISECPELEELNLAQLSCLKKISIENCDNLKSVSGISNLENLQLLNIAHCSELEELRLGHLESITIVHCKHLKRVSACRDLGSPVEMNVNYFRELVAYNFFTSVSGVDGFRMLAQLNISECPELEELWLDHLSCLQKISIENCSQLKSVSGINNLAKLVELEISDCRKLEFDYLRFSGMGCLETIIFDRNVKVKHFELDDCQKLKTVKYAFEMVARFCYFDYPEPENWLVFEESICLLGVMINGCGKFTYLHLFNCQNLKGVSGNLEVGGLYINDCPELEQLPNFATLSCMEQIHIENCGKLQNIMLPTSLTSLYIRSCSGLQRISTTSDLTMLMDMYINICPDLEELPVFSSLSCMEKFHIEYCGKLQSIMLPTSLTSLYVKSCLNLQRASTTSDLTILTELHVSECPELEKFPVFSSLSCMEQFHIEYCGKLQSIMLPTSLTSLYVKSCLNLRRMSTTSDLTILTELHVSECPELEQLPIFSNPTFMQLIHIDCCGK